jgi:HPt (histidine-containing phosphotransfer) domain-containing protein
LIEELRTRFLPRFVETSQGRLARARALFERGDAPTLAEELHALAGEAMMLDLGAIADNARRGESAARVWSSSDASQSGQSSERERATCASCLAKVGEAVAALSQSPHSPPHPPHSQGRA